MATLFTKYYQDEFSLIMHHLARVENDFPMHDIHRVRVGVKKLKALHRMLASSFPGSYVAKNLNRPYKKVFKSFGRYREAQISLSLLKKYGGKMRFRNLYLAFLEPDLELMKKDMSLAISEFGFDREKIEYKELMADLDDIPPDRELTLMYSYMEGQRIKAMSLLSEGESSKAIHSVRIVLKNIKPFLKLLSRYNGSQFSRKHFKRLNRTESRIGDWHDRLMLSESLTNFIDMNRDNPYLVSRSYKILKRIAKHDSKYHMARLVNSISVCLRSLDRY